MSSGRTADHRHPIKRERTDRPASRSNVDMDRMRWKDTVMADHAGATSVYLEIGKKRVFACALDWPGWCRSGKDEESALAALATYAPRYAVVAKQGGHPLPDSAVDAFEVVERLPGSASTDFGVPERIATADAGSLTTGEGERLSTLVTAAWAVFDQVAAATPAELRKGPRGGGRDRDKMIDHVVMSEVAYARKLGITHRVAGIDDREAITALRTAISDVLRAGAVDAQPFGWPSRYAARRIAWHALDHAWEMEDRTPR
jgi:hypothetical protein